MTMTGALAIIQPTMPLAAPQAATGAIWHIIRSEVQGERKAFRWLSYRFFRTYLPTERRMVRLGRGHKRVDWKPLLPGYVFVCLPEGFDEWDAVRRMPGVDDFLIMAGRMATLSEGGIEALREIEAKLRQPQKSAKHTFREGDHVRLTDEAGYWAGVEGKIQRLDKREKVVLSLILPARVVPVTVSASWLKSIDG